MAVKESLPRACHEAEGTATELLGRLDSAAAFRGLSPPCEIGSSMELVITPLIRRKIFEELAAVAGGGKDRGAAPPELAAGAPLLSDTMLNAK
jgi:hypothetical protein